MGVENGGRRLLHGRGPNVLQRHQGRFDGQRWARRMQHGLGGYLYRSGEWGEPIFSRPVLLEVIGRFMHLEVVGKSETMIFPRFQQLDAVRKLMAHARDHGAGNGYRVMASGAGQRQTRRLHRCCARAARR